MDYSSLIEKKRARFSELESEMAVEGFYNDAKSSAQVMREYDRTRKLLESWETLEKLRAELEGNQELAKSDDADMAAMAAEEIPGLEEKIEEIEADLTYMLLPHDPTEDRDAIFEIRADLVKIVP